MGILVKISPYPVSVLITFAPGVHYGFICPGITHRLLNQASIFPSRAYCVIHAVSTQKDHDGYLKKIETVPCVFFKIVMTSEIFTQHSTVIRTGNIIPIQWKVLRHLFFMNTKAKKHEVNKFIESESYYDCP